MPLWFRWDGNNLLVNVLVQPRSREDRIIGIHGDALKIKITSPPVDGKANQYLCEFLARLCGISKSAVKLESGDTSRKKRIRIQLPSNDIPHALLNF